MSEKLKLAIRLSADPKAAVKAFAELKRKSKETGQALEKTQEELKVLNGLIKATGGQDAGLVRQFEAARNRARQLKTAWQGQQVALEQSRRSLSAMGISTANLSASVRRVSRAWVEAQAEILAWGQSRRNEHLADKRDVKALEAKIREVEVRIKEVEANIKEQAASIKALELAITRQEAAIKALEVNLTRDIREMEHKLTIKLGAFLVIGVTVLTLLDRLL